MGRVLPRALSRTPLSLRRSSPETSAQHSPDCLRTTPSRSPRCSATSTTCSYRGSRTGRARASSRTSRPTGSEPAILGRAPDRRPQPGRDPLAHVARAAGARGGDARLARAAPRLAAGLHGHIEDTASTEHARRARRCARGRTGPAVVSAPSTPTPPSTRRRSCSTSSCARCRATTSSACGRSSSTSTAPVR